MILQLKPYYNNMRVLFTVKLLHFGTSWDCSSGGVVGHDAKLEGIWSFGTVIDRQLTGVRSEAWP